MVAEISCVTAHIVCLCGISVQWRYNERHGVSNYRHLDWLLSRLIRHRSKKTSKLRVTDLCEGNPVTGELPTQMAGNTENVSIWLHNHDVVTFWESCLLSNWTYNRKYMMILTVPNISRHLDAQSLAIVPRALILRNEYPRCWCLGETGNLGIDNHDIGLVLSKWSGCSKRRDNVNHGH